MILACGEVDGWLDHMPDKGCLEDEKVIYQYQAVENNGFASDLIEQIFEISDRNLIELVEDFPIVRPQGLCRPERKLMQYAGHPRFLNPGHVSRAVVSIFSKVRVLELNIPIIIESVNSNSHGFRCERNF